METNLEHRTSWAKVEPPLGAFDDYVIIESLINHNRFYFRSEEFDFMMSMIHNVWKEGKIKYFQILKEWNELSGYDDTDEPPSKIENPDEFIKSLQLIKGNDNIEFGKITNYDIIQFINFMNRYKEEGFIIMKE